jgi:spore coat protein U-like protein
MSLQHLIGLLAALVLCGVANSATLTGTLPVSASVSHTCQNLVVASLIHGSYDPASAADNDAQSTLSVQCTNTTPISFSASTGIGTLAQRQMGSGTNRLDYNLFTNSARTNVWGDGTGGTSTIAAVGAGLLAATSIPIFSRIPKGQSSVVPGSYSDSIVVTVTY